MCREWSDLLYVLEDHSSYCFNDGGLDYGNGGEEKFRYLGYILDE